MTNEQFVDTAPNPVLSVRGATVMRGERPVLRDIDLEIQEGQHTAILGSNGAGKTSLIGLLTRQHYPLLQPGTEPPVRLFGRAQWDVTELRSLMGIVTADLHHSFAHAGGLTAFEAVLSGFFGSLGLARHHSLTESLRDKAAAALVRMDAWHLRNRPLAELSTGEARRVLIARALAPEPRALLLDEPTTGLDLAATYHFLETIRGVMAAGVTLLLVTHHVEEIVPEIQSVVLLRDGRVFAHGDKRNVLTSPKLSELYGASIQLACGARPGYFAAQVLPEVSLNV